MANIFGRYAFSGYAFQLTNAFLIELSPDQLNLILILDLFLQTKQALLLSRT